MASSPTYDELPRDRSGAGTAWGLYGAEDSIGCLNLITSDVVRDAVALVRRGATFGLDTPVGAFDPPLDSTRSPARHRVLRGGAGAVEDLDDVLDDYFPQIASQWDSLAHIAARPGVFYNDRSVDDVLHEGLNTIDHWSRHGVVTRGVLLDVARAYAKGDLSPSSDGSISVADLEAVRVAAGLSFSKGCAIVVRTGFYANYRELGDEARRSLASDLRAPGIEHTEAMAGYLWDSGAAAVVSDSFSTEVWPPDFSEAARPYGFLHRVLIGLLGFAIGELWNLEDLSDDCDVDGIYEFLLTSAPLHLTGGIGSPANALAIK